MKHFNFLYIMGLFIPVLLNAQNTFTISGTAIPDDLLKMNYGPMPKGIAGYDLNICNVTDVKKPITSSEIYQALMEAQGDLRPIGKQIMLAVILRNQNHSLRTWLNLGLGSTTSVLSVLGQHAKSSGTLSAVALAALVGQQVLTTWNPVLTADQVEKFEAQTLESALVMDGGSCVERTIFTTVTPAPRKAIRIQRANLQFKVR
jgi:hypothetical protein